jgi:hypothetical protein
MIALVTHVGRAAGARAAAAALACAAAEAERAALLVDLDGERTPRPSLVATAAARELEERLAAHLPGAAVAARGRICVCAPSGEDDDARLEQVEAALPLARESLTAVHVPPSLLQRVLAEPRIRPDGALLRADLPGSRALTALAVCELIERRIETVVVKQPLAWLAARAALLGALPPGADVLPRRAGRLLP